MSKLKQIVTYLEKIKKVHKLNSVQGRNKVMQIIYNEMILMCLKLETKVKENKILQK